jgi:hypothetical protein
MKPDRKLLLAAALLAAAACAFGTRPAIGVDSGLQHTIYKQPAQRS